MWGRGRRGTQEWCLQHALLRTVFRRYFTLCGETMMSFKVKGCWARTRIFGGVVVAKTCESRRRRRFNVGNAFFSSDEKNKTVSWFSFQQLMHFYQRYSHGVMTGTLGSVTVAVSTAGTTRSTTKWACAAAMWQSERVDWSVCRFFTITREFGALGDWHCTEIFKIRVDADGWRREQVIKYLCNMYFLNASFLWSLPTDRFKRKTFKWEKFHKFWEMSTYMANYTRWI